MALTYGTRNATPGTGQEATRLLRIRRVAHGAGCATLRPERGQMRRVWRCLPLIWLDRSVGCLSILRDQRYGKPLPFRGQAVETNATDGRSPCLKNGLGTRRKKHRGFTSLVALQPTSPISPTCSETQRTLCNPENVTTTARTSAKPSASTPRQPWLGGWLTWLFCADREEKPRRNDHRHPHRTPDRARAPQGA